MAELSTDEKLEIVALSTQGQWAIVAVIDTAVFVFCVLGVVYLGKLGWFDNNKLAIAYISGVASFVVATILLIVAATNGNTRDGVLTTQTWFGAGWENGLSLLSVRIDTYYKYLLIVGYQICRSFLGSVLLNVFRSYLLVEIQGGAQTNGTSKKDSTMLVVGAQICFNFFIFVSSVIDSMLVLSSIDMTVITMVSTMVADAITTCFFMQERQKKLKPIVDGTTLPNTIRKQETSEKEHIALRLRYR